VTHLTSQTGKRLTRVALPLVLALGLVGPLVGQEPQRQRLDNGLFQIESTYLRLTTDLPISDELSTLPAVFDQAIEKWCKHFNVDPRQVQGTKATAFLMKDRSKFVALGLIPSETGNFRHGYQFEDQLFLTEQPSDYYRRHLLLHEGTHWFLWKFHGGNGPPWFSEGTCEQFGTHVWDGEKLTMGVIPDRRERFPYWGRLKLIQDSLDNNAAPTLNAILSYNDIAHRTDEPYAWSWAAMLFFSNHPKYQALLRRVSQPPLDYSHQVTIALKKELSESWPLVDAEWRLFVSELDFGYSPKHSLVDLASIPLQRLEGKTTVQVRSDQGWQSTGVFVESSQSIRFLAQGSFTVRTSPAPGAGPIWKCEPQGITVEYHRGHPLGQLIATIVPVVGVEIDRPVGRSATHSVGRTSMLKASASGLLLMKVNESSVGLVDNVGALSVTLEPDAS
jgi:hypothetical protein